MAAIEIIDRYVARPKDLDMMCLAQFAKSFSYQVRPPKGVVFDDNGHSNQLSKLLLLLLE